MQYFNWSKKTFVIKEKFISNLWFQIQKRKRQNVGYFGLLITVNIKKSIQKLQILCLKILLSLLIWKSYHFLISLQNFLEIYCSWC